MWASSSCGDYHQKSIPSTPTHGLETTHIESTTKSDLKPPESPPPPPPTPTPTPSPPPPVPVPNKPPELTEIPKEEKKFPVSHQPENPKKPYNQSKRPSMDDGLQANSVLGRKTCHLKELYKLGRKLGEGVSGTTFLCVDKIDGKEYACKTISKRFLKTKEDLEGVRMEVQILRHLAAVDNQHPNVISFKEAYEDEMAVQLVMDVCEGGNLLDRTKQNGHYTEKKASELARIIVGVVESCHLLGVMHRDLKPENFLFVNQEEDSPLKLIDFGLSTFFRPGETFYEPVGTPNYVAPEVLLQKGYGPEADVWSAGVIIYALLSDGMLPFRGKTNKEVFRQVLYGNLDFVSEPWPRISESAKDLVKKMLVRDPKRRLTTRQVMSHPWLN